MSRLHANNVSTTITTAINTSVTSIVVTSAAGFPTLGSGQVFRGTLSYRQAVEIVEVTNVSGTTLTVTRGMEGTTAQAFPANAIFDIRATADSFDRKADTTALFAIGFTAYTYFGGL